MSRRIGMSATRVERQLSRAADAVEEGSGERPTVPPRDRAPDGEPHWESRGDVLVYAMRDGDNLVWRWETDDVGTLTFWAMRDATFRLASAWEERTRPPGEGFRWQETREKWAELIGLVHEPYRRRHLDWLEASDRSGFVGWPNPAEVVAVIDRLAATLADDAGQPHGFLPGVQPRDDAQPWIETHGDELCYRVRAGDRDLRNNRTTDISELLFWVFDPVTREMARASAGSGDWRGRWLELMVLVNPDWRERVASFL